jgi:chorismate mutase
MQVVDDTEENPKLILVHSSVVPTVFLKVLEAKKLLSKGICKNSSEACKAADISRSAFYKYKDSVFFYEDKHSPKTITLYLRLSDEPGVLSAVLSLLYQHDANVLTVNQNVPIDGVADVTITIRIDEKQTNVRTLKSDFMQLSGVVEFKRI